MIMTPFPVSSTAAMNPPIPANAVSSNGAPTAQQNIANQNVFLQLLVAQLKNQDPSKPTDGTAFVTELAQFSTLQENTSAATDLHTIVAALPSITAAAAAYTAANTPTTGK